MDVGGGVRGDADEDAAERGPRARRREFAAQVEILDDRNHQRGGRPEADDGVDRDVAQGGHVGKERADEADDDERELSGLARLQRLALDHARGRRAAHGEGARGELGEEDEGWGGEVGDRDLVQNQEHGGADGIRHDQESDPAIDAGLAWGSEVWWRG